MNNRVAYQLLLPASQNYIFRFYQDSYHWNVWFQGIKQAWFESEPRLGTTGTVVMERTGSWKMKVIEIHDDRAFKIVIKKRLVALVFEVEIEPVRDQLSRVNSQIIFSGLFGVFVRAIWGKRIRDWLQINLYGMQRYAEIHQKELAAEQQNKKKRKRTSTRSKKKTV